MVDRLPTCFLTRYVRHLKCDFSKLISNYKLQCDMTNEDEVKNMFKWVEDHADLGKVDVCIPNAGFSADKSLLDGTMEEWRSMLDVNVLSLQLCTQLAVKSMLKVNPGRERLTCGFFACNKDYYRIRLTTAK